MDLLLYQLLCKRTRRKYILCQWHSKPYKEGEDVETGISHFFEYILTAPLALSVHEDYLNFFQIPQLQIKYAWLTTEEKSLVKEVVQRRHEFFGHCQLYMGKAFSLWDYKKPIEWKIENRREILRDFVYICTLKKDFTEYTVQRLFLLVCQKIISRNKNCDKFIKELHAVAQGRNILEHLTCCY